MSLFKRFSNQATVLVNKIKLEEFNNQGRKVMDKLNQKKDAFLEFQKARREDPLYRKEEELNILESRLLEERRRLERLQDALLLKERQINTKEKLPKYVFAACTIIGGITWGVAVTDFSKYKPTESGEGLPGRGSYNGMSSNNSKPANITSDYDTCVLGE